MFGVIEGRIAFKDTFQVEVLKIDCLFLFCVSSVCVLFQLSKTLILPSLSSANISKYIFTLIKMTGPASKFHMDQRLQKFPL